MDNQMDVLVNVLALLNWFAALYFYADVLHEYDVPSLSCRLGMKAYHSRTQWPRLPLSATLRCRKRG